MADTTTQDPLEILSETLRTLCQTVDRMSRILLALNEGEQRRDAVLVRLTELANRAEPLLAMTENNPVMRFATSRRANRAG